jgi:hypothetical protein
MKPQTTDSTRYVLPLVLAVLCLESGLSAVQISEQERRQGLEYMDRTRDAVLNATRGLTEEQWRFKPAPGRWSIAEITEHLALAEDFLFGNVTGQVMKQAAGKADRDNAMLDKMVLTVIPDRSNKATAPEPLTPAGRWTPAAAVAHFEHSRARTTEYLKTTAGLRDHVMDSPIGQPLDAYQWLLFAAAHCERHTKQILEVKAHPAFPKK